MLWARKLVSSIALNYQFEQITDTEFCNQKDDPDVDRLCIIPPNILSLDRLHEQRRTGKRTTENPTSQPIHVNITNNPLAGSASANQFPYAPRGFKRTISYSESSDDGTDIVESLTISDVLDELHDRYPKLDFPQYADILADKGIVYAESVVDFDKDFYLELGISEGAIGPFMKGIHRALHREKKEKKRAKLDNKENQQYREQSLELI